MITMNTSVGAQIVASAQAFAARHRAPAQPAASPLDRPATPEDAVRRLSDDMIDVAALDGTATEEDLLARGWTLTGLRQFGAEARDRANAATGRRAA